MGNTGKVRASHILVKKMSEAQQIMKELDGGADFAAIAKRCSTCSSGKKGGDLGFFHRGKMVKEFETAVYSMKVGDTVGPVKTAFGYHVIKRTG